MTDANETTQCTYTTLVRGNPSFIRAVGIPLADALEDYLPSDGIYRNDGDLDESLAVNEHPRNDAVAIAGVIAVVLFFASWITKKILDDIYTAKIQPKVKEILGQSDEKLTAANARNKKMYQLGVWYAQRRVFVLVGIVGDSFQQILNHHDLLPTIHANAIHWIRKNGRQKSIHLYLLEDGRVNVAPLLFDTLSDAHNYIDKQGHPNHPRC